MAEETNKFDLADEQQDTADLLERLFGKSVSDRYVDFCRLSAGAFDLRVSTPMAAHAIRELDSILRQTLEAPLAARVAVSDADEARIAKALAALGELALDNNETDRVRKALSPRFSHRDQIKKIVVSLGLAEDGDIARKWIAISYAHEKAHERPFNRTLTVDDAFRAEWTDPFHTVVRAIAVALQSRYSALMLRVGELAQMGDTARALSIYEREIPGALPLQWHFFSNISGTAWLPELISRGLIVEPQPRFADETAKGKIFGEWPVGRYLIEMAKSDDQPTRALVVKALASLADANHPDVRRTGFQILAALPPQDSAPLAYLAAGWLTGDAFDAGVFAAEKYFLRLAEAHRSEASVTVARSLLQVLDQNGSLGTLYSHNMYEHSLPTLTGPLTNAAGLDALRLLVDLLYRAAIIGEKVRFDPLRDYTSVLSTSLPEDESAQYDIFSALVAAVRKSAIQLIEQEGADVGAIMTVLTEHPYMIFKRITLNVLAKRPGGAPHASESLLFDVSLLESYAVRHEYAELAIAWFPSLSPTRQTALLALVDDIPPKYIDGYRERVLEHEKRKTTDEDERLYTALIIRDATWYWRSVLPAERRKALEEIVAARGDPDAWKNRFNSEPEQSPMSANDFAAATAESVAAYLKSWTPGEQPSKQTPTALGMELRKAVEADPGKYSAAALSFGDLSPLYVRRFLEGLHNVAQNKKHIDWLPVLRLMEQIVPRAQPPAPGETSANGDDPSWFWAAKAAAELLRAGLWQGADAIALMHERLVETIIAQTGEIAPERPEFADFDERFERYPYFGAEATIFGLYVELNVLRIYWMSRHEDSAIFENQREALARLPAFDLFAQRVLAADGANGRIVRAVFGRYLDWLTYFGQDWVKTNYNKLFPESVELRQAAWLGHLLNGQPVGSLMPELAPEYRAEIARLATNRPEDEKNHRRDRFGDYFAVQYLWGTLPRDIFDAFFPVAPSGVRQHVMWFVGRELSAPPEKLGPDARARALAYWDLRMTAAETAPNKEEFRKEIGTIGLWYSNLNLDSIWLMDRFLRMLRAGYSPNNTYALIEWAAKVAQAHPDDAVEFLDMLFSNSHTEQWAYSTQQPAVRKVLVEGRASVNRATQDRVDRIVSVLATKGEPSFLDLARKP